jgi:hypothetical protein
MLFLFPLNIKFEDFYNLCFLFWGEESAKDKTHEKSYTYI